jgi:hypothetical protein
MLACFEGNQANRLVMAAKKVAIRTQVEDERY